MARLFAVFALLVCLGLGTGCGDAQARIGVRNSIEAAKFIGETSTDPAVVTAARAIVVQLDPAADQMDLVLWGLWTNRSKATIPKEAWVESPSFALKLSNEQAVRIEEETDAMVAKTEGIMDYLGGALQGGGVLGLLLAGLLKHRQKVADLVTYAGRMRKADTEEEALKIDADHPAVNKAIAKAKKSGKLS